MYRNIFFIDQNKVYFYNLAVKKKKLLLIEFTLILDIIRSLLMNFIISKYLIITK